MKRAVRENIKGLGVVLPVIVYYALFTLVPVFMMVWYAFRDYSIRLNKDQFIGLENFSIIFSDSRYLMSIVWTMIIAVFVVAIGMVFGFLLAYLLNKLSYGKGFLRTLWYVPALVSLAIISTLLNILLGTYGSFNNLLESMGLPYQNWYDSVFWMYFWIIIVVSWKGLGGTALYFIAGLNGIDKSVLEAADIDGCHGFKRVWYITLPMMRPMLGYILITGFIGAFNIFEPVQIISGGRPEQTKVILYRIYDEAFANGELGLASAISIVVFIVVFLMTLINMKVTDDSMFRTRPRSPRREG